MAEFFNWLSSNSLATTTLIVTFAAIVTTAVIVFLVAFLQGREVCFWPPKIGPRPAPAQPEDKNRKRSASVPDASQPSDQNGDQPLVIRFANPRETLAHTLKRMQEAQESICDISWERRFKTPIVFGPDEMDAYLRIIENKSQDVSYREIVMFCGSQGRVDKVRRLLNTAGKYYQLAGYADIPQDAPSLRQFVVIDGQEVILKDMAVQVPEIVQYFVEYYDELWTKATPIKVGIGEPDLTLLLQAEQNLKSEMPQRTLRQTASPKTAKPQSVGRSFPQEQIQNLIKQHNLDFIKVVASRDLRYLDATTTPAGKEQAKEDIQSWIDSIDEGAGSLGEFVGFEILSHRFISDQELEVTIDETWRHQLNKEQPRHSITRNIYCIVLTDKGWLVDRCQTLRPGPTELGFRERV